MKTRMLFAAVLLLGGAAFGGACPESLDWDAAPSIGRGMKYIHLTLDEPRLMENYLVRVDLRTPGLRVTGSGRASNWGAVMTDYTNEVYVVDTLRVRTRDFMEDHRGHGTNMVLALNTSPWGPWRPPFTHKHGRFASLVVSDGQIVSHARRRNGMLVILTNNVAMITNQLPNSLIPSVAIAHPGHGFGIIMQGGKSLVAPRGKDQKPSLAPRTAFGLSADGRWLYGVVVDGRQPGCSEGADGEDLVRILKAAGAVDAINMDGGGSSTFAWWNDATKSVYIPNRHDAAYRRYRPVAMNLGFYFTND